MRQDEYALLLKQITELVAIVGEMKGKIGLLESENAFLREMLKGSRLLHGASEEERK